MVTEAQPASLGIEHFATQDPYARIASAALRLLFGNAYLREFGVRLWDGTFVPAAGPQRFVLGITEPGALRAAFHPPFDLSAGRAFAAGLIVCDGDVETAVDVLFAALMSLTPLRVLKLMRLLRRLPEVSIPPLREASLHGKLHSRGRDRSAIGFHYDQPIAFYRAFLGRNMIYSCAYFDDGIETLDAAQSAKLDYILKKLRLNPGERFLDIGCGWGALVIRAAQQGANALGITLSRSQYEEAARRIEEAGVGDRARVELRDYRELAGEYFDKVASVGMFEHVGRARLPEYFNAAYKALRPGGLFLNHGIAEQSPERKGDTASRFIERFVFPDGELVPVSYALLIAERCGFEVRDVENLREHYTRTLRAWVRNLEDHRDVAEAAAGEQSYRTWRLYMAGSAQGFRVGRLGLFQALLSKSREDGSAEVPRTRRDLYEDAPLSIV